MLGLKRCFAPTDINNHKLRCLISTFFNKIIKTTNKISKTSDKQGIELHITVHCRECK